MVGVQIYCDQQYGVRNNPCYTRKNMSRIGRAAAEIWIVFRPRSGRKLQEIMKNQRKYTKNLSKMFKKIQKISKKIPDSAQNPGYLDPDLKNPG